MDCDPDDELQFHLEQRVAGNLKAGMPEQEALVLRPLPVRDPGSLVMLQYSGFNSIKEARMAQSFSFRLTEPAAANS